MTSTVMCNLDGIMNRSIEEIICLVEEITAINKCNEKKIKHMVLSSDFSNKYEIFDVPDNYFLKNLVMCLAYSSINPFLASSPAMNQYDDKIVKICELSGLNVKNIKPICEIENELMNIIKTERTL